jgi:hypothetical protein
MTVAQSALQRPDIGMGTEPDVQPALKKTSRAPILGVLNEFVFPFSGVFWLRRGLQSYLAHAEGATFLVNPVAKL